MFHFTSFPFNQSKITVLTTVPSLPPPIFEIQKYLNYNEHWQYTDPYNSEHTYGIPHITHKYVIKMEAKHHLVNIPTTSRELRLVEGSHVNWVLSGTLNWGKKFPLSSISSALFGVIQIIWRIRLQIKAYRINRLRISSNFAEGLKWEDYNYK